MATARFTLPKIRLASLLRKPGGPPVAQAVVAAETNVKALEGDCRAELLALLARAEETFAAAGDDHDPKAASALYEIAVQGVGLGEVGDAAGVDVALHSLCDLLDNLGAVGRYDAEAIGVHLRAWRLLMTAELSADDVQVVLDGLAKVSAHYAQKDVA